MAGGSIMIVGAIILATSTTVAQLIVGRIVTGIVRWPPLIDLGLSEALTPPRGMA